mmetsp:Transcript_80586/g.261090  ORF Transcript_80586/g.261090 Transcript_80586/m.261090 type:complete len:273 (+) Transcript_80586:3752-4570(+)
MVRVGASSGWACGRLEVRLEGPCNPLRHGLHHRLVFSRRSHVRRVEVHQCLITEAVQVHVQAGPAPKARAQLGEGLRGCVLLARLRVALEVHESLVVPRLRQGHVAVEHVKRTLQRDCHQPHQVDELPIRKGRSQKVRGHGIDLCTAILLDHRVVLDRGDQMLVHLHHARDHMGEGRECEQRQAPSGWHHAHRAQPLRQIPLRIGDHHDVERHSMLAHRGERRDDHEAPGDCGAGEHEDQGAHLHPLGQRHAEGVLVATGTRIEEPRREGPE